MRICDFVTNEKEFCVWVTGYSLLDRIKLTQMQNFGFWYNFVNAEVLVTWRLMTL